MEFFMKKYLLSFLVIVYSFTFFTGCANDPEPQDQYDNYVRDGWTAFQGKNYNLAIQKFNSAKGVYSNRGAAYLGLGWSYMLIDSLNDAVGEFSDAENYGELTTNLFAGWAVALNALKRFDESNFRIAQVFQRDTGWVFQYDTRYTTNDLNILSAENYFLLGEFSKSLDQIRLVNPAFTADILTPEGLIALAAEIERQKRTIFVGKRK
jgi:tetratricopeptide (TPR) repeat protein